MTDPISGNIHRFISHGNELPLSSWGDGPSGAAIPTTRSDGTGSYVSITQWRAQELRRDRWTLQNMWYPASHGSWYLSGASGTLSLTTTPFEWEIRPDRLGGHRIVVPGTTQVLSSVGSVGNGYILATLQSQDLNKDSQRWTIQ